MMIEALSNNVFLGTASPSEIRVQGGGALEFRGGRLGVQGGGGLGFGGGGLGVVGGGEPAV